MFIGSNNVIIGNNLSSQEHYVEYSRLGNVIKGQERAVAKSKYEEDIHINNHSVSWHGTVGQHSDLYTCKSILLSSAKFSRV